MELVELHDHPEYLDACCDILNKEWKRSYTARAHSLSKSTDNLPVSLVLVQKSEVQTQVLGHSRVCRVLHDKEACFVESVIIIPEQRGKGLGRVIMKLTEDYARRRGFTKCHLSTHDKQDFYKRIGYSTSSPVCGVSGSVDRTGHFEKTLNIQTNHVSSPPKLHVPVTQATQNGVIPPPPPMPETIYKTMQALRNISFGPQYTTEQQDQVLRILNHSSEKELQKLSIGASSILRILHHREENGGFESIDHVLSIRGFQEKGLKKICEAVLYGKKPQVKRPDKTSIIPALSQERIQDVAKVLAVDVSPPYITWAHVTRDKQILSWERIKFLEEKSRHHLHSYYNAVQQMLPVLPVADLYVVEQRPTRQKQSAESLHLRTQLAIQAMLVALLSHGKECQPQVVSIKSAAVTQLFQLNVGNERISGQETLKGLFDSGALTVEQGLKTSYLQESSVNREHLCNVLLLAHAFYLLVEPESKV
ncbi:unnamed protein product [Ixodes hexagonus]